MSAALADLQAEYRQLRAEDTETGVHRLATANAYGRWFNRACADGTPPDALRVHTADEVERFFARTIQGPDGHVYWDGNLAKGFRRNDGRYRKATWWWWERVHGPAERGRLDPSCGEQHCINPEHLVFVPWGDIKQRYSDMQIIGALQVAAMRLGHPPTTSEWRRLDISPTDTIIAQRFGSWSNALRAAGLEPRERVVASEEQCIASVRFVSRLVGHAASRQEMRAHARELGEAGLPSGTTVERRFGRWADVLRKAGVT